MKCITYILYDNQICSTIRCTQECFQKQLHFLQWYFNFFIFHFTYVLEKFKTQINRVVPDTLNPQFWNT